MSHKRRTYVRFLILFGVIGGLGVASALYTLVKQRVSLPFTSTYDVTAEFSAADGVISGIGQPVNVSGVNVGQVVEARLEDGRAVVRLQIDRGQLPHVYTDATAALEPITPLNDMQIDLDPGTASAGALRSTARITVARTSAPVPLSALLSTLDGDTRDYLTSLVASVSEGTSGRGPDIHRILTDFGPTARDVGEVSRALAARRVELARLVHNLAIVTRAASEDRQLGAVVKAGDETVLAVAAQDAPLRRAIAELPPTLAAARTTLSDLQPFADQLGPTLDALSPVIDRLPATLRATARLSNTGAAALADGVTPLVSAAVPLTRRLRPLVSRLLPTTPNLSGSFQVLEYLTNEFAYNAGGNDQGFLFWFSWFVHNFDSLTSFGDANGGIGRATPLFTCYGVEAIPQLLKVFGLTGLCPT